MFFFFEKKQLKNITNERATNYYNCKNKWAKGYTKIKTCVKWIYFNINLSDLVVSVFFFGGVTEYLIYFYMNVSINVLFLFATCFNW